MGSFTEDEGHQATPTTSPLFLKLCLPPFFEHTYAIALSIFLLSFKFDKGRFCFSFSLLLWVILSLFGVLLKISSMVHTGANEVVDSPLSLLTWLGIVIVVVFVVIVVCRIMHPATGVLDVGLSGMEMIQHLWVLLSWVSLLVCLPL